MQHYQKILGANTVAYLNVDVAVSGESVTTLSVTLCMLELMYI